MSGKASEIIELLAPVVTAQGLELLGVEFAPTGASALLRLYIDAPGRLVGIEDCEVVSREVAAVLDVHDPISSQYTLEVSSPGVDRPLFTPVQFARFLGEKVKIGLKLPQDGRRKLQGKIVAVEGERIDIDIELDAKPEPQRVPVAFDNIEKARLVPDWAKLGFGPAKQEPPARPDRKKPVGRSAGGKPKGKRPSGS